MGNSRQWTTKLNINLEKIKAELKANGVTTEPKRRACRERAKLRPNSQPERAGL